MEKGNKVRFKKEFFEYGFSIQEQYISDNNFSLDKIYKIEEIMTDTSDLYIRLVNDKGKRKTVYSKRVCLVSSESAQEEKEDTSNGSYCSCSGGYILNTANFKVFKVCKSCGKEKL